MRSQPCVALQMYRASLRSFDSSWVGELVGSSNKTRAHHILSSVEG